VVTRMHVRHSLEGECSTSLFYQQAQIGP